MRRVVSFLLGAAFVILIIATGALILHSRKQSLAYADLKAEEQTTRDRYGQAVGEIAAIQDSLNTIVLGDSAARLIPSSLETEMQLSGTHGDEALARIAVLKAGVERTKQRIVQLDANLRKNGLKIVGLEKMVAFLKRSVAQKEKQIVELAARVDSLNNQVVGLVAHVQEQDSNIEDKRRELGTVYYVIGTKKDLTTAGVVVAKGGLLGIGKTVKPTGQFDEVASTPLDTDHDTVIHIPAPKAQILSAQPASSSALEQVGTEIELHILDPREVRKIRHVVIMTT